MIVGVSIAAFAIGFVAGWETRVLLSSYTPDRVEDKLVVLIVTLIWASSVLAEIILESYATPVPVHGIMGVIVGYFFAKERIRK